jgi:hypothetical protein
VLTDAVPHNIEGLLGVMESAAADWDSELTEDRLCRRQTALFPAGGSALRSIETGCYGSHVSHLLIGRGHEVVGLDNMNEYYDVTLKQARLARLEKLPAFRFVKLDLDGANLPGVARNFVTCCN